MGVIGGTSSCETQSFWVYRKLEPWALHGALGYDLWRPDFELLSTILSEQSRLPGIKVSGRLELAADSVGVGGGGVVFFRQTPLSEELKKWSPWLRTLGQLWKHSERVRQLRTWTSTPETGKAILCVSVSGASGMGIATESWGGKVYWLYLPCSRRTPLCAKHLGGVKGEGGLLQNRSPL